jgi:hypothetical protein
MQSKDHFSVSVIKKAAFQHEEKPPEGGF